MDSAGITRILELSKNLKIYLDQIEVSSLYDICRVGIGRSYVGSF